MSGRSVGSVDFTHAAPVFAALGSSPTTPELLTSYDP
jgi:hypothetical protein